MGATATRLLTFNFYDAMNPALLPPPNFFGGHDLCTARSDDIKIGLALVELYDRRLAAPGRAMTELRRLIDLHPGRARQLRRTLNQFRRDKFGAASEEDSTPT